MNTRYAYVYLYAIVSGKWRRERRMSHLHQSFSPRVCSYKHCRPESHTHTHTHRWSASSSHTSLMQHLTAVVSCSSLWLQHINTLFRQRTITPLPVHCSTSASSTLFTLVYRLVLTQLHCHMWSLQSTWNQDQVFLLS